jgi:3-deoxy-D-manno-octulosonic-acid transferase
LSTTALPLEPGTPVGGSRIGRVAIGLYGAAGALATPLIAHHLARRRRRGKEHPERWRERFGWTQLARPAGPLLWLHGASVGEALSALPLIDWLREQHPRVGVLVTTATVTSAALLAERLPAPVLHQFVPVDLPAPVHRFLDHWRPDAIVWLESELWPMLLSRSARRGTPMVLVNGRLSAASHARWRWARPVTRTMLAGFRTLLGQSEADAARLADLSERPVRYLGNLKRAAPPLPHDPVTLERLRARAAGRPLWLAASTHEGEEVAAAAVHRRARAHHPGLITVIVPRHPARGPAIRDALTASGVAVALRSAGHDLPAGDGIYIADTLGELGLWYRLVDLVFIGGSLAPIGGHNPLEPARLGCALAHGPHVANFGEITAELDAAGASERVRDAEGLADAIDALLGNRRRRRAMADAAQRHAAAQRDVVARIAAELEPYLRPLDAR